MRWIGLALAGLVMGCTITVKPLPVHKPKRHRPRATLHSRYKTTRQGYEHTQIVDSVWMANYKKLELQYNHSIPADEKIRPVGSKFVVPQEVINHFSDLMRADMPYATPL